MKDVIERLLYFDIAAYVVIDETKTGILEECADVLFGPGRIVIHTEHFMTLLEEALT